MIPPETSDQGNMVSQREGEWVLVPREPTAVMMGAGARKPPVVCDYSHALACYRAMISAAPPAEPRADEGGVSVAETASSASPAHPMGQGQAGKKEPRPNSGMAFGVLNPYGDVWSYDHYDTPEEAAAHLAEFWKNTPEHNRGFKIVPVEVTVSAICTDDLTPAHEASPLGAEPDADDGGEALCLGCPPYGYPTDKTRCLPCPRRVSIEPPPLGSEPPCDEGNLPPAEQITQPSHDDEGLIERLPSREQINEVVRTLRDENDTCLRWKETTADWLVRFERNRSEAANTISRLKGEREGLHLAICGGEDAPGYAASLSHETILRVLAENYASAKRNAELAWDGETATSWKSRSLGLEAEIKRILHSVEDGLTWNSSSFQCLEHIGRVVREARSLLSPAQEGLSSDRASRDARSSTRPEGPCSDEGGEA